MALRVGFLGTGSIAQAHARSLLKLSDVQIVALCNRNIGKAQAFNEKLAGGKAVCYADFDQMIRTEAMDLLYVCLPPGGHTGQTELAAARGVHLMLEKPIALNDERATSIATAVRNAGVVCQIGHHMRHTAPAIHLRRLIDEGSTGRPVLFQGRFFTNALFPTWWRDPNMGGGQMIEQSIHLYDLARYFFGDAASIASLQDNRVHDRFADYKVDDVSASTVLFQNGAIANICASNCADPQAGSVTFTVLFEKVMAEFTKPDEATFSYHGGTPAEQWGDGKVERETIRSDRPSFDELSEDLVRAIREKRPTRSSVEDGLKSLQLVLAGARSSRDGAVIKIP